MDDVPAIRVSELSFQYEKAQKPTLQGIQFTVEQGKFIALMGETGAGKTSLLMTLNGLIPHFMEGSYTGNVTVHNLSTRLLQTHELVETVGMVLQDPETQIFGFNIWEDVAFGPSNMGVALSEIKYRVGRALQQVGLQGYEERSTEFLSGGEKQRLAIAGILAIGPRILLLDEPTSELDPEGKMHVFSIVQELQKKHDLTIVMAEHESEQILAYADQVIVMQSGKIAWQGKPEVLFADEEKVNSFQLNPPAVASLFWAWKRKGVPIGDTCPRNASEMVQRLNRWLEDKPILFPTIQESIGTTTKDQRDERKIILEVQNLVHTYPNGHQVLHSLDLQIAQGDCIALIGHNGAGKSTLCKHFNGLLQPSNGRILFDGKDLASKETSHWATKIGYVFQNPDNQIFSATVLEEVMYGLQLQNLPRDVQKEKALVVLRFLGLEEYLNVHPFTLNKGLRQLLAIASVLVLEPEVLIIDEPTTGQDHRGMENILALLQKLKRKGHTLLLITHNMKVVTSIANRVLIMHQGRISKDCTPEQAFSDDTLLRKAHILPLQVVEVASELRQKVPLSTEIVTPTQLVDELWERVGRRV